MEKIKVGLNKIQLTEYINALSSLGTYNQSANGQVVAVRNIYEPPTTTAIAKNKVYLNRYHSEVRAVIKEMGDEAAAESYMHTAEEYELIPLPFSEFVKQGNQVDPNALAVLSPILEGFE